MNSSPVVLDFSGIDKNREEVLFEQIAQQIVRFIQSGILKENDKLPGTRQLAQLVGVHRKTIIRAVEDLIDQGWLEVKPNVGTFVAQNLMQKNLGVVSKGTKSISVQSGFTFKKSVLIENPIEDRVEDALTISDGRPDFTLPFNLELSKIYNSVLKKKPLRSAQNTSGESLYFKTQLANYFNQSRGFFVSPKNILVTKSVEMALQIVSSILFDPEDIVVVGEMSYYKANMIFQQNRAKIKTLALDDLGLDIDALENFLKKNKIRAVYVNSNAHYPTTVSLDFNRRIKLLELAEIYDFVIIEDDLDSDFQYQKSFVAPLFKLDTCGRVLYLGTFGKALLPNFSVGFVLAPQNFIKEASHYIPLYEGFPDLVLHQVLAEMIYEGVYNKNSKKAQLVYKQRRDLITDLFHDFKCYGITFVIPPSGLSLWLNFPTNFKILDFVNSCKRERVFIPRHLIYQNKHILGLRLGFADLTPLDIDRVYNVFTSQIPECFNSTY